MKTLQRLIVCSILFSVAAFGQSGIGQVKSVTGDVQLLRDGATTLVKPGDMLEQQDTIVTGVDSSVGITFIDNSRFSSGPETTLSLKRFRFNSTTHEGEFVSKVKKGTIAISSGQIAKQNEDAMKVELPTSVLAVRGTKFLVQVR